MGKRSAFCLALLLLTLLGGAATAPGVTRAQPIYVFIDATITPATISTDAPSTITIALADRTIAEILRIQIFTCPETSVPGSPAEANLVDVSLVDDRTITATVPAGMSEGLYVIHLSISDAEIWLIPGPLTVVRPSDGRPQPWQATSSLSRPRWQFSAAAAAGWLYVVGDQPGPGAGAVEGAPILADGSLGPWRDQPPLNTPRTQPAVVAAGGYLYVFGGFPADSGPLRPLGSAERAPLLAGGGLGPWEPIANPPFARGGAAATLAGGRVYLIGGIGPDDLRNSAFVAEVSPAGDLGAWRVVEAPPLLDGQSLPNALVASHHSSLFYLGGIDRMVYRTDVFPDGSLAPWRPAGRSLGVHVQGGSAVIGDTLYAVGGFFNCVYGSNFVERATIGADGSLGPWEPAASTGFGHGSGALVASGSYLYAIAGLSGFGSTLTAVEYTQAGPIAPAQELVPQVWLPVL